MSESQVLKGSRVLRDAERCLTGFPKVPKQVYTALEEISKA